jgi:type I restriction enzyme S subunit
MSELPPSWEMADGDDLFSSVRGVTYSKADAVSIPSDGLVPILRANNIADGRIVADDLVYVPAKYVSPEQYLRAGDLLIATSSGSRTVVGKAAAASDEHRRYAFGAFCTVARPRVGGFGDWLSRFARTRAYRDYVEQVALGISINNLRGSDLKSMPIRLAPFPEQRRIVAKIDSLTGKSRCARDHLDHIPRLVEKYEQAVLAAAFQGERGVGGFDWHECKLADVCKLVDGDRGANYPKREDYLPEGYCLFLSTKNVRPHGFDFSDRQYLSEKKHREMRSGTLERGDVVITTRGTVGNVAYYGDAVANDVVRVNSGMLIMRPAQQLRGDYLAWFVRSPLFMSQVVEQTTGSAQPQLPAGIMKRFSIRFPSKSQQFQIVQHIETAFTWIGRLTSEATSARKLIDHLDQATLAKAFQGELVPQDPADEPAAVLLERIRAERGAGSKARRARRAQ